MALKILLVLLGLFSAAVILFLLFEPAVGQAPKGEDLERIAQSPNYADGKFINQLPTQEGSLKTIWENRDKFFGNKNTSPTDSLPVKFGPFPSLADTQARITWYGHSAFLIEIGGQRVLIDPMLGEFAAPISLGANRFPYQAAIPFEDLTDIDLLIISHDHYDHLDYPSILALKDQVKHFVTPLGVGSHLKSWGIEAAKITELDWWEEAEFASLKLAATPARHFSGRSLWKRNSSQWASWVIRSEQRKIYFSGDGGYGPHFKEIGEKYGPFDLSFLECGQYNEAWSQIHMMPEESVQAGVDLKSELIMPIHWGAFALAMHEWTDPILRFQRTAQELAIPMVHPFIGESFVLGEDYPREEWWKF